MRKWAFGFAAFLLAAAMVMGAGSAFADNAVYSTFVSEDLTGGKHRATLTFASVDITSMDVVSPDLNNKYGAWALALTASADVVIVKGDLGHAFAWGIVGDFLGHRTASPDAELDLTTTAVPADISSLDAYVPTADTSLVTWGSYWHTLSTQKGLTINVTLDGLSVDSEKNANELLKIFAGEYASTSGSSASSVKGLAAVSYIPLNRIALASGTLLAIPPTLSVKGLKIDAASIADFSAFDGLGFVTFAEALTDFEFEVRSDNKASLILPPNITNEELVDALEALASHLPTGKNISDLELQVNGETKSADEILNPKSSSGCDAGFGLGGVLLLAGAALIGRKRG
jgi:hypothetical protein